MLATDQQARVKNEDPALGGAPNRFEFRFTPAQRDQAIKQVQKELTQEKLLDGNGNVSKEAQKLYSFEKQSALPTPGILVKGCLDDCDVCEPTLMKEIELDLENKRLKNEFLKKQIELLAKSQEYRCCPAGEAEPA